MGHELVEHSSDVAATLQGESCCSGSISTHFGHTAIHQGSRPEDDYYSRVMRSKSLSQTSLDEAVEFYTFQYLEAV